MYTVFTMSTAPPTRKILFGSVNFSFYFRFTYKK